jgi:basic membrane protein A
MKKLFVWFAVLLLSVGCTKGGDTIYKSDPNEEAASTKPLVTVIYDANALGDRSFNDLIYEGVERTAQELGLRTMQQSPRTYEEGVQYLELMFRQMETAKDSVRRLFIVTSTGYDDFIRKNNKRLEANPYADLLYLETRTPLEGKGSTLFLNYYGAMYEGGRIEAATERTSTLLIGANRKIPAITEALQGYRDGFEAGLQLLTDRQARLNRLATTYLDETGGGGFSVADTTALRLLRQWGNEGIFTIVPVCGGASNTFSRMINTTMTDMLIVGIDIYNDYYYSAYSIVKHVDRAVANSLRQWLTDGALPKHQSLGLAEGYTEVILNPVRDIYIWTPAGYEGDTAPCLTPEMKQEIHEEAVRKEEEHEKQ